MPLPAYLPKTASVVLTGLIGASTYQLIRKTARKLPLHNAAVTATEWCLRTTRHTENLTESARLKASDILAEAKERLGEETTPPHPTTSTHQH